LFPRKHNRIFEIYTFIQHSPQINHRIFVASYGDWFLVFVEGNEWWDLCAGPHVETTGQIEKKAIELESVAGAYWRGDEKNAMLQRIYGTAWESEEQLKAYIFLKEEAKRRDHRRLGQDLDLFSIQVF
jgi:threonyl-tRNA synthetase